MKVAYCSKEEVKVIGDRVDSCYESAQPNKDINKVISQIHIGPSKPNKSNKARSLQRRRCTNILAGKCEMLTMDYFRRGRGRLKKYHRNVIRKEMTQFQFIKDMILDRRV
ncbi:hypothetical protein H5410_029948 [Solanum commersonii]|uniref:Uncharacterized protein n=1 Tax=Solanum commersonii TaxID=4109 RepID=A0A9J5YED1_SOLCO|nr:hypothetical protein H5410_029948 [Solanum commersonii]